MILLRKCWPVGIVLKMISRTYCESLKSNLEWCNKTIFRLCIKLIFIPPKKTTNSDWLDVQYTCFFLLLERKKQKKTNKLKVINFSFLLLISPDETEYWEVRNILGMVTNAKNIKADSPKILRPTHFWSIKDIKADSFLALTNIKADL